MRQITRTEQRQKLNQSQQHSLKVLSMSGPELDSYLQECYDRNPFLCKEEKYTGTSDHEAWMESLPGAENETISDLYLQAHTMGMNRVEEQIGNFLIGSLDEHGYLTVSAKEIAGQLNRSPEDVERVIRRFQAYMEPGGVFARSVVECLLIQLARLPEPDRLAMDIVRDHLPELAARDYEFLAFAMDVDESDVERAVQTIQSLEPHPLNGTGDSRVVNYKVPEIEVLRDGSHLEVQLLERGTSYSLDSTYRNACKSGLISREERKHFQGQLSEARQLMDAMEQRRRTVLRVTNFLVEQQKQHFLNGTPLMGLTQTDAAAALRISVSTVSRTVREKYYLYENEVYGLSGLFATKLRTGISREEIQSLIRSLISSERKDHPITDAEIARYCSLNGHCIARRTISKYRESMKIPPASLRRTAE